MGVTIEQVASYGGGIEEIYNVFFHGEFIQTTVTCDSSVVSQWIYDRESFHRNRLNNLIVGLDVEWRPSFSAFQSPIATLQLCIGSRCLIYQLLHTDALPCSLDDFLCNSNYTFVGDRVKSRLEKLSRDHGILTARDNSVDLAKLAAVVYDDKDKKRCRLKGLSRIVLNRDMEKPRRVEVSDWDDRWLTDKQVKFASVDAYVSFKVGRILLNAL